MWICTIPGHWLSSSTFLCASSNRATSSDRATFLLCISLKTINLWDGYRRLLTRRYRSHPKAGARKKCAKGRKRRSTAILTDSCEGTIRNVWENSAAEGKEKNQRKENHKEKCKENQKAAKKRERRFWLWRGRRHLHCVPGKLLEIQGSMAAVLDVQVLGTYRLHRWRRFLHMPQLWLRMTELLMEWLSGSQQNCWGEGGVVRLLMNLYGGVCVCTCLINVCCIANYSIILVRQWNMERLNSICTTCTLNLGLYSKHKQNSITVIW